MFGHYDWISGSGIALPLPLKDEGAVAEHVSRLKRDEVSAIMDAAQAVGRWLNKKAAGSVRVL